MAIPSTELETMDFLNVVFHFLFVLVIEHSFIDVIGGRGGGIGMKTWKFIDVNFEHIEYDT